MGRGGIVIIRVRGERMGWSYDAGLTMLVFARSMSQGIEVGERIAVYGGRSARREDINNAEGRNN